MPQFSNQPPTDPNRHGFRLIRTPAAGPLRGIVISNDLVGCPTHFVGNRTIPCERPNCDPCSSGIGWRWHGYLLILVQPTQEQCIFEFTAAASDNFKSYRKRYDSLRGCLFLAQRVNNRHNGRVLIQCKPADLNRIELPRDRDLPTLLCHIWNISPNQTVHQPPMDRPPFKSIRIDRQKPELHVAVPDDQVPGERPAAAPAAGRNGRRPAAAK